MTFRPLVVVLPVLLLSAPALADEPDRAGAVPARATPKISLTTDAALDVIGVETVRGELLLGHGPFAHGAPPLDVSGTLIVGAGSLRANDFSGVVPAWRSSCGEMMVCEHAKAAFFGVQAAIYPIGSFRHGLQLGAQLTYRALFDITKTARLGDAEASRTTAFEGSGFEQGLFVGYKLATGLGLTVNPQLAYKLAIFDRTPLSGPALALNAGWSF